MAAIDYLTTAQVAASLGVSPRRVRALVSSGRLPAHLVGGVLLVNPKDVARVADRPNGRPPSGK